MFIRVWRRFEGNDGDDGICQGWWVFDDWVPDYFPSDLGTYLMLGLGRKEGGIKRHAIHVILYDQPRIGRVQLSGFIIQIRKGRMDGQKRR